MTWIWLDALPALLAALGWLLVPGLLTTYALGMRGLVAWTLAPTVSSTLIAVAGVFTGKLGWHWSPWCAVVTALPAVLIFMGRGLRRIRFRSMLPANQAASNDFPHTGRAAWLGLVPAFAIGGIIIVRGFRTPDSLSQTYDAVFHLNAMRWIIDSGDASSLTMGSIGSGRGAVFYPASWHGLATLVALTSSAPIPVAANMTAAAVAVLGWPLACLFLVRQVFGPAPLALATTGVVSVAFSAFPWGLLSFGVLWPNALGLALVPVGLGAGLSLLRLARHDALTRGWAWVVLGTSIVGTGLAQPNATFTLAALLAFPFCCAPLRWAPARWLRAQYVRGRTTRAVVVTVCVIAVALLLLRIVDMVPMIAAIKQWKWSPYATVSGAVGEVLLNATNGREPLWLLSAAVITGFVIAFRQRTTVWIPFAHLGIAALFVMCAAVQTPLTHRLTGFWYNDSYRLAASLPVTGVVLAVGGITWAAGVLLKHSHTGTATAGMLTARLRTRAGFTCALTAMLFAVTAVWEQSWAVTDIRKSYSSASSPDSPLVDANKSRFFDRISHEIPHGAVVANNPWDGSAMLWALTGTRVLFPQLDQSGWTSDQKYLAAQLNEAGKNSNVCAVATRLGVRYLLVGQFRFWLGEEKIGSYPGITDPANRPGFDLVDQQGPLRLYRISACSPGAAPNNVPELQEHS